MDGRSPSGAGQSGLRPEPASRLGHSATVPNAEEFARAAHDGQRYGGRPYVWHLEAVVDVLRHSGFGGEYLEAAWLHDVSEDVGVPIAVLREMFGERVADLVKACTGVGRNRRERNACIYGRIAKYPDAAIVKVADRIANVEAASRGSAHAEMYLKEALAFHDHVARLAPETLQRRLNRGYAAKAHRVRDGNAKRHRPEGGIITDLQSRMRIEIQSRDWSSIHIIGDKRPPLDIPDRIKRLWR